MLTHGETKGLTDYVVEWHCEEVSAEEQEAEAVDTIELTPLSLLLEELVDLDGLTAFSDSRRRLRETQVDLTPEIKYIGTSVTVTCFRRRVATHHRAQLLDRQPPSASKYKEDRPMCFRARISTPALESSASVESASAPT